MALPRITQKEMTEREQRELKTLLDRARIAHGRPLTNAETNSVKKEYIDKLMALREAEAKKARQLKKKQAYKPDAEASFFLVGKYPDARQTLTPFLLAPRRGKAFAVRRRAGGLVAGFFNRHDGTLDAGRFRLRFCLRFRF
ncbi:YjbD family (DUF3811) [Klebsiella michiganensis]|uniref:YjbD family (DUF3811) n=5 Tax=Klebsiella TaxID=570 RepID=A0A7H4PDL8_9ENTR|nr:YjbD family (DUF3811) [Klebsiella michiganensis]